MNALPPSADRIEVPAAALSCRIGVAPGESDQPQTLRLGLSVYLDLAPAARSVDLAKTVDYAKLMDRVEALLSERVYVLLEEAAEAVCSLILEDPKVCRVEVRVEKVSPPWPERRGAVAVRLTRERVGRS